MIAEMESLQVTKGFHCHHPLLGAGVVGESCDLAEFASELDVGVGGLFELLLELGKRNDLDGQTIAQQNLELRKLLEIPTGVFHAEFVSLLVLGVGRVVAVDNFVKVALVRGNLLRQLVLLVFLNHVIFLHLVLPPYAHLGYIIGFGFSCELEMYIAIQVTL